MKALNEVKTAIQNEYNRAAAKFGAANNSLHESYKEFWRFVKENETDLAIGALKDMQERAEHAAAEWIQVAAMCYKATKKRDEEAKP